MAQNPRVRKINYVGEDAMKTFKITFFGTRGSSATGNPMTARYGNNTSCALVEAGERFIILDMGTGVIQLANQRKLPGADILLSHFHYDHIEGMPYFMPFFGDDPYVIHAEARNGLKVEQLLSEYMRRPYFPITPEVFSKNLSCQTFAENASFSLGEDILIETMHTNHSDFATAFKIRYDQKSLVYLLDHEHGSAIDEQLIGFCHGAELVVYDAYFTTEEYNSGRYNSWGHSTYEAGLQLAKQAEVKQMVLCHHAIWRTDAVLDQLSERIKEQFPNAILGSERLEVVL